MRRCRWVMGAVQIAYTDWTSATFLNNVQGVMGMNLLSSYAMLITANPNMATLSMHALLTVTSPISTARFQVPSYPSKA